MRARKPCVRTRLILLGWNVRFVAIVVFAVFAQLIATCYVQTTWIDLTRVFYFEKMMGVVFWAVLLALFSYALLRGIAEEFARTQPFKGLTIGTGIHLEAKTVAQFIEAAKTRPGGYSYASPGHGTHGSMAYCARLSAAMAQKPPRCASA